MLKQRSQSLSAWPLRAVVLGLALLIFLFLLPLLLLSGQERGETAESEPTALLPQLTAAPVPVQPVEGWDESQTVRLLKSDGTVERMSLRDYLWGVVAAEMPASFRPEALKAQTVAGRTYCLYQQGAGTEKHPGADVCADYACCQAYLTPDQAKVGWGDKAEEYAEKLRRAVAETDGLVCLYQGQPIDAVFFSSAAGRTSDAVAVWGTAVPYLTAVDSPEGEEVPGWRTEVSFPREEFAARLQSACPEADLTGPTEEWVREVSADEAGLVTTANIGGASLSGGQLRSLFGLRSAHFTLEAAGDELTFRVTGYGHGVGMSQYGANALAGEGKSFREILEWYYSGVQVGAMAAEECQ